MFIAMNRFQVRKGHEDAFEDVWKTRESHLDEVDGFVKFHLLRGPEAEDHVLYASHTIWSTRGDFENWTRSEQIRKAHADAGNNKVHYLGHPNFEGFDVIQSI